jgi:GTP-binding protein HflX
LETTLDIQPEKVLLIGLNYFKPKRILSAQASLDELAQLTETTGGIVEEKLLINREAPHPGYYLGKGKIEEVNVLSAEKSINLIIIDDELSIRQQLNLDQRLQCRVIDRSTLILQIFADRAKTREGKLQIELAQLSYLMPRLSGKGKEMSRLGGGIGTRGPGESQLEKDRRHIRNRIESLKSEIEMIRKQRNVTRSYREKREVPVISLVGYTNAGKSTLLNTLTQSEVTAEDKLFATLDPSTRRLDLFGTEALLTDTVGFIQQLPHSLVTAFRATLEEATFSDLLIHVIDASHPDMESQIKTVHQVLEEIGCKEKPIVHVFNKADLVADPIELQQTISRFAPAVMISAKKSIGLDELKRLLIENLPKPPRKVIFSIPSGQGHLLNQIYEAGSVLEIEYGPEKISGTAILPELTIKKLSAYIH